MGESSNTPEASAIPTTPEVRRVKSHRKSHKPRSAQKPFGGTLTGKAAKGVGVGVLEGTKLGAIKGYELARGGVGLISETARLGWRNKQKLMYGAVGSALTIIAQNPRESRDVSLQAYEQVVNQAGKIVRDFGGEQPSKTALDSLTGAEKSNPLLESVVDTHYQGMVGEEREQLKHQIELMGIYMADKVTAEGFENVAAHEDIFEAECAKVGVNPAVVESISFAETGGGVLGKLEHKTKAGALGPMGITDGLAIQYGLAITNDANDPRLDWGTSIKFACERIGEYTRELGDVSLATAAWHRGPTAVKEDIEFWANENGLAINGTIAGFSEIYGLNDWKLRQNKELRESWDTDEADMTNIYPTRVAGSNLLKLNVEAIAQKQVLATYNSAGE